MLICTKPTLLIKTQYWLPFIRLIMKYQYHLPSQSASVNRSSNECVSLQTHLDPVTYINLEIAPDGCRKLIGLCFDGRFFFFGQVKWNDWSRASRWSSHTIWDVADASYPAWLYHSSEGSCEFMVLLMHTCTSAIAPVSRYRLFTPPPKHTHIHWQSSTYTVQKWLPEQASKGPSNESYRSAEQKISVLY